MYIGRMRANVPGPLLVLVGLVVFGSPTLRASVADSPEHYQSIPQRNVFGLTVPSTLVQTGAPPRQLPQLTLTGITTILGDKRALLKARQPNARTNQVTAEDSMILAEGQRAGPVEVLAIDESAGRVKVKNSGTVETLTFEANGPKPVVANTTPAFGVPLGTPLPTNAAPSLPTRAVRMLPNQVPTQSPYSSYPAGSLPALSPTGGGPLPPVPIPKQQPIDLSNLTPEEQAIVQHLSDQTVAPSFPAYSTPASQVGEPGTVSPPSEAKPPDTVPAAAPPATVPPNAPGNWRTLVPQ